MQLRALCRVIPDRRGLRLAFPLALMALLAGCWMSDEPLIGTENASVVNFQGPFKPEKDDVVIKVRANPDGSYSLTDNKGEGFTAFFLKVRDDWYAVQQDFKEMAKENASGENQDGPMQLKASEGKGPYLYNLMHFRGRDLLFYMPDCDDATAAIEGVTRDGGADDVVKTCVFDNVPALEQAALDHIRRLDAGEIEDEPNVLHAIDGSPD